MDPHQLRYKPGLTRQEIITLSTAIYSAARENGVKMETNLEDFNKLLMFAVHHEVGGFGLPYKTQISNGVFAGLLQNGVDILVEGNAATKDGVFKQRRPVMWTIFKSGIHRMYTRSNRKLALQFHASLKTHPRFMEGTAVDPLVAIASYLDTVNWAYKEVNASMKRNPSPEEVYAFHLHGYVLMTDYYRLKAGKKGLRGSAKLSSVTNAIKAQLKEQSLAAKRAIGHIGIA